MGPPLDMPCLNAAECFGIRSIMKEALAFVIGFLAGAFVACCAMVVFGIYTYYYEKHAMARAKLEARTPDAAARPHDRRTP